MKGRGKGGGVWGAPMPSLLRRLSWILENSFLPPFTDTRRLNSVWGAGRAPDEHTLHPSPLHPSHLVRLCGLVEHASIDLCCQEVVGSGDGVDVPSQVEVEVLHGDDLRVAPARSTTWEGGREGGGERGREGGREGGEGEKEGKSREGEEEK